LGLAFLSCALLVSRAAPLAIDPEMVYLFGQAKAILSLARAILVVLFFLLPLTCSCLIYL